MCIYCLFRPFPEIHGFGGDYIYLRTRKYYFEINYRNMFRLIIIIITH